jgi:hypothetical protein
LCCDVESAIKPGAEVFPRDARREFDQCGFFEMLPQRDHHCVRRNGRRLGQRNCIVEHQSLQDIECIAFPILGQIGDLLFGDAILPADGRADVQSEQATRHRCHLELAQVSEYRIETLGLCHRKFKEDAREQDRLRVRHELQWSRNRTEFSCCTSIDLTRDQTGFGLTDPVEPCHGYSSSVCIVSSN